MAAAMVMRKTVKKKIAGEIPAIRLFPCLSGEGLTFIPDHLASSREISCWPPTTNSGILKVPVRGSVREIMNYQNGRDIQRIAYNSGPSTGWGLLIFKQFFLWWYVFQLLASSFQALFAGQSPAQTVFSLQAKRIVINFHYIFPVVLSLNLSPTFIIAPSPFLTSCETITVWGQKSVY